jgi:hypothetical protein
LTSSNSSNSSRRITNDDDVDGLLDGFNITSQCIHTVQRIAAANKDNAMIIIKYLTEQQILGFAELQIEVWHMGLPSFRANSV